MNPTSSVDYEYLHDSRLNGSEVRTAMRTTDIRIHMRTSGLVQVLRQRQLVEAEIEAPKTNDAGITLQQTHLQKEAKPH